MTRVSELLGIDQRIGKIVAELVDDKTVTMEEIKVLVKQMVDSLAADVYSNMKEIEHYKYRVIEIEIWLSNLSEQVKLLQRGEVK